MRLVTVEVVRNGVKTKLRLPDDDPEAAGGSSADAPAADELVAPKKVRVK